MSLENNNSIFPNLSAFGESMKKIREATAPLVEIAQQFQSSMASFYDIVERIHDNLSAMLQGIADASRPFTAIVRMGEAQFVYWNYMTDDYIRSIVESKSINKTLREIMLRDHFKTVNETIKKTCSFAIMKKHLRLYSQSIQAFRNGQSDLAIVGLTSVFDGLLTDISNDPAASMQPRIKVIKQKIESDTVLSNEEYAIITFTWTFDATLTSFSKKAPFNEKEPKGLNRHWIAHGRSRRKRTKLDCVKLINLIYGLLLLDELDRKEKKQDNGSVA